MTVLQMWHFIETASNGVESLHVLVLAVRRVFVQDIRTFMLLCIHAVAIRRHGLIVPPSPPRGPCFDLWLC